MFKGQSALITGGSRGIGLAIAKKLANQGATITLLANNESVLKQSVKQLSSEYDQQHAILSVDLLHLVQENYNLSKLQDSFKSHSILVNCAGITTHTLLQRTTQKQITETINLNLTVPIILSQLCVKHMMRQRDQNPSILNIASVLSLTHHLLPGTSVYAASKAGLLGFTKSLAHELKGRVRVNALLPALVKDTEMGKIVKGDLAEVSMDVVVNKAVEVLSELSVNGECITLD
ncbi:hypothetical protein KGF57_001158 [Candida theae]|uniref:3-oxoacyl-[acyl-carrier-protein] reductase n=1 Tax=Candida theae TaxID=1198502 RepID=A0AAD5FZX4_9ASCO|nr:uncharacterized protein KGF57_001158 [Candida theae]KAI5963883.1 hypothetical protein KGF57_001158 [Candida theae]